MHRTVPLLAVLSVLACAPAARRDGEVLAPGSAASPIEACVDKALAASPLVDQGVAPKRQWAPGRKWARMRGVRLMNPPGPRIQALTFAVESPSGTPRTFVVEYFSPGQSGMQPAQDPQVAELERQAVAEIGAQLLREVRAACMPSAVAEPTCSMVNQGRVGRCALGT